MTTAWLLMAQYEGMAVIPIERVAVDHFGVEKGGLPRFLRKIEAGESLCRSHGWSGARRGCAASTCSTSPLISTLAARLGRKS